MAAMRDVFCWAMMIGLSGAATSASRTACAQKPIEFKNAQTHRDGWHTVNRVTTLVDADGRQVLRFDARNGAGFAWSPTIDFTDGDIDVDIRGRDVFQKSFVGIAFRIANDSTADVVYFRPFNFKSTDSTRHSHAVQYIADPAFPWEKLRADHPGAYEAKLPGIVDPNAWMHVRLSVHGTDLAVFINRSSTPVLHVQTLSGRTHGSVGPWVGDLSPGDFANLALSPSAAQATSSTRVQSSAVVGDLRLDELTSDVFHNKRFLRVLLPDGYDAPENRTRRYPVLYMADGQNLFDPATSVFGPSEWRMDEVVHQLVAEHRIPPMIVVGVDDAGRTARAHEYLAYPDTENASAGPAYDPNPEGKRYPDFMIKEVMPFINQRYRTMRDAAHTGIGGSSYGAWISTYVIAVRPGVFGRALLESPTYAVHGSEIFKDLTAARSLPERVFVAVGTNENGVPNCKPEDPPSPRDPMVNGVHRMAAFLKSAGLDSSRAKVLVVPCGTHTHAAWAARLPTALTFLFGDR
jgi:predicted alpha/beta superfamily hydrolase